MQFGFNLPNTGALAAPDNVVRIAREGETLGYDYLTVTDHVVLPDMAEPGYPYSESGAFYSRDSAYRHEMLTLAAYLAAVTAKLRVVLAVLVVPHRPAVLAAKMLSTIDILSGGRLTIGIGAGWLKAEFDAVVITPFAERGAVTDEYLAADGNRRLFSGSDADLIADIHTLRDLGVTAIDFDFERPRADDVIAEMSSFRDRVLARV